MTERPVVKRCPVCGSTDLVPGMALRDNNWGSHKALGHEAYIEAHPAGIFSTGGVTSPVRATVCGDCGYVMLFADLPGELRRAYRERQGQGAD